MGLLDVQRQAVEGEARVRLMSKYSCYTAGYREGYCIAHANELVDVDLVRAVVGDADLDGTVRAGTLDDGPKRCDREPIPVAALGFLEVHLDNLAAG